MNDSNIDFEIDTSDSHRSDTRNGLESGVRRGPLQWNLKALILLALLCASWFCYYRLRHDNERMRSAIQVMRAESKALVILHADRVAVVSAPKTWSDQKKWNVALPSKEAAGNGGAGYKLCLATSGLQLERRPTAVSEFSLPHGRREIELKTLETKDGYNVTVLLDDQPVIVVSQPHVWTKDRGWIGSIVTEEQSFQPARAGDAVSLYSIYYTKGKPTLSKTRSHGVELWLEPVDTRGKEAL
ncbi:MAG: hypothetical protein GY880_07310 [Planctomycetaceae bacterium]|nr:hypothetical protein [Planctomycetaceae bacterium]